MRSLILFLVLATPIWAETPLDGGGFEALVNGKTLTFSVNGQPYGVEYYAPGRRVIWSFVGGDCINGEWYEDTNETGPAICFTYENDPEPKCWQVFDEGGGIRATFLNRPDTMVLYEISEAEPLVCGGLGT